MTIRGALIAIRRAWREAPSDAAMHWRGYVAWRERLRGLGVDLHGLEVLDLGSGERAQLALLFASDGARVTAADLETVELGARRFRMWSSALRESGLRRAARLVVRDLAHTVRYWRVLGANRASRLPFSRVTTVRADAERLPFPSEAFDLVVSSAVWEHILDVPAATAEVHRVLRPGGRAIIQIALFPSLEGGHHAEWHTVDPSVPRTIRPWDHLFADHRPFPTQLNEWREDRYRETLGRVFLDVTWEDGETRGTEYLGSSERHSLPDFTDRELTLSGITAWVRRTD